jgi:hypothetical protein
LLLHGGRSAAQAATSGYQHALLAGAALVLVSAFVAMLAPSHGQTIPTVEEKEPALDLAA